MGKEEGVMRSVTLLAALRGRVVSLAKNPEGGTKP
jgi:hypothetical protein